MLYELYDCIIRADIDSYKRGRTIFSTTNCPNCGAPVIGRQCEYCETVFYAMKHFDHIDSERRDASHIFTVNEMRELLGFDRIETSERNRYIEQELRGPYAIKW